MAERRQLPDLFERDLHQIPVPPESEWFPTAPTEHAMPPWLLATTAVAAITVAIVFGSYLYSRLPGKPGSVLAPPTPSPVALYDVSGRVTDRATGQGVSGVRVYLDLVGPICCTYYAPGYSVLTDANGNYRIRVRQGNYRVLFIAARGGRLNLCPPVAPCGVDDPIAPAPYESLWWPNGRTMAEADELTIDRVRDDVNAALRIGHEIVGSFVFQGQPQLAFIVVQEARGKDLVTVASTNTDGTFRVAVSDGVYYIEFAPLDPGPMGGAWPRDIVVQGADVVGIDRVEP